MPFFQNQSNSHLIFLNAANRTTLQVRSPRDNNGDAIRYGEKRVWDFASFEALRYRRNLERKKQAVLRRRLQSQGNSRQRLVQQDDWQTQSAAVSVEAALALSIFIFAMVCMMIPFRMMERQRQVQAALESVNEKLCQYAYLEYMLSNGEEIPKEDGDWKQELLLGITNGAAGIGAGLMAEDMFRREGMDVHTFLKSSFLEDGETIAFRMDYRMRMPFSILNLKSLPFTSESTRRAWIGRDGLGFEEDGGQEDQEDPIVYVGKNSTRYHRSRECHYLSNRLQSVDYDAISRIRNQSGGKYYPCAVCGSSAASGSMVYIMESGSRYHATSGCTAIIAYVKAVKLSEVEHLGGCSYCSR